VIAANRGKRPTAKAASNGALISISEGSSVTKEIPARTVRLACQCASCVDEWTGRRRLDPAKVPQDVVAIKVESAGRYAVTIQWSDLHSSIYPFSMLKTLS